MGNKNGSYDGLMEETKQLLMKRTGMSQNELKDWYKTISERSKNGKLNRETMISIYKDLGNLDPDRIGQAVDSIAKAFDDNRNGSIDVNEFIRGFVLTTKGDLQTKVEYTFRLYDQNGDDQISGDEIKKMADAILRMLGSDGAQADETSFLIVQQFLEQFTGGNSGVISKQDFVTTVMENTHLMVVLSPFYGME